MAKTGPKRRTNVSRYPSGKIRPSDAIPKEAPSAPALEARVRHILGVEAWRKARGSAKALKAACNDLDNPLLGSALGRLLLVGRLDPALGISKAQYGAGGYFGWIYRANAKIRGWPSPNAKALDYGAAAPGFSIHPEDSSEYIADIKAKWSDMYGRIIEADNMRGDVFEALKRVLLEDIQPDDEAGTGALKVGLNAVDRARGG